MHDETNKIPREAKHVANELHHFHDGQNEKGLHHIQKELHDDHARDPKRFNELVKDIKKDLKTDHEHRHLGIEYDHKGRASHVTFDKHDIYGHADHKKQEKKGEQVSGKDSGSGYLDSSKSKASPSKDLGSGYLDSSNSRASSPEVPREPDVRPETIAKILAIKGSGAPTGIPFELPGRDGNG